MKWLGYLVLVVIGIALFLLAMVNTGDATFNYLLDTVHAPLLLLMMGSFILGALMMLFVFGFKAFAWRSRARKLQAILDRQESELNNQSIQKAFEKESA